MCPKIIWYPSNNLVSQIHHISTPQLCRKENSSHNISNFAKALDTALFQRLKKKLNDIFWELDKRFLGSQCPWSDSFHHIYKWTTWYCKLHSVSFYWWYKMLTMWLLYKMIFEMGNWSKTWLIKFNPDFKWYILTFKRLRSSLEIM